MQLLLSEVFDTSKHNSKQKAWHAQISTDLKLY